MTDDLYAQQSTAPITESDKELECIVTSAELPVLLAAIACATGDTSYLPDSLRPPLTPVDTHMHPHGGMSEDAQHEARALALKGLVRIRDEGVPGGVHLSDDQIDQVLDYLSNGTTEWRQMLRHEFPYATDGGGAPGWSASDFPAAKDFSVLIIGAGVAGIAAAYRYAQSGLDFTVIEAGDGVGGTWRKNTYPGVRLDTPTFGYSYSFAQRTEWPHQFATGGEVLEYLREVADRAGITDRVEFRTRAEKLVWNSETATWTVTTADSHGERQQRSFNAVVSGLGQLDNPNIPAFEGLEDFTGKVMHSQEWENGVSWKGQNVACIGTGASAYQIVPAMYQDAASLVLFQRSAPWMLPADNYHDPLPEAFGWLCRHVPGYGPLFRLWTFVLGTPGRFHTVKAQEGWDGAPLSVSPKNEEVRQKLIDRLTSQFEGRPDLVEIAVPNYPPGAKRMLRDNGVWAEALKDPDTTVVTSGVGYFTKNGIVDGEGTEHSLDIVVLATGFTPSDYLEGIEVIGVDGREIHDFWAGDSRAYNGVTVPGYPNFFMLYGPNIGGVVAGSLHFMIERSVEFSLKCLKRAFQKGADAIDVRESAMDEFVSWVAAENRKMAWGQEYVSTWYQNSFGRVSQVWPFTNLEYWDCTETVQDKDHVFLKAEHD